MNSVWYADADAYTDTDADTIKMVNTILLF